MSLSPPKSSSFLLRAKQILLAACASAALSCARPSLPAPELPLVPTQDAPFRATPPALPAELTSPRGLPEIQATRLSNGLAVWVVPRPGSQRVTLALVAPGAGRMDGLDSAELISLTARSVVEGGTVWYDGRVVVPPAINGRTVGLFVRPSYSGFTLQVVRSALEGAFQILGRTLTAPAFGSGNLDAVRLAQLKTMQTAAGSLDGALLEVTVKAAFGKATADQLLGLNPGAVQRPSVEAIKRCYHQRFRPESVALIAVGDLALDDLRPLAESSLGIWQAEGPPSPSSRPARVNATSIGRHVHFLPGLNTGQASILLLQPAPNTDNDNDQLPFALLAKTAVGAVRSRANLSLRHGAGVTYGVSTHILSTQRLGLMTIEAAFENEETATAISELFAMLDHLQRSPVSERELSLAKIALAADLERATEDQAELVQLAAGMFTDQHPPEWLQSLPAAIDAITPADLLRVARAYLRPSDLEVGVAGAPFLGRDLAELGELAVYHVDRK